MMLQPLPLTYENHEKEKLFGGLSTETTDRNKPKEYPNSDDMIDLFLLSAGVGVRDVDNLCNTESSRSVGDKCREELGEPSKEPFLKQQHLF